MKSLTFVFLLFALPSVYAQLDTSYTLEVLNKDDILKLEPQKNSKVYAASRMPEDPSELPTKIYIIEQEVILENNYSTLVDVLNTIPGFRTSQPGDAVLGETFLMRGLLGNSRTKILINGIPIKPFEREGMDIAAQLPIKQADRIEVILGPAASVYGSDAMAGVINIVIEEADRPMETMVNIAMGSGTMTETHLSLGGKLFKDKNVLSFNFFGNYRNIVDYNLALDDIRVDTSQISTPFYVGEPDDPTIPEIRNLSHQSNLIGARVDFREFTYNFQTLYRKDHSGIGAHPQVVDFSDVGNYVANRSYHHSLSFNRKFKKYWSMNTNVSALFYEMDNNSSYKGTSHPISNSKNFMYASSTDYLVEQLFNYNRKNFKALFGGTFFNSQGIAGMNYIARPFSLEKAKTDSNGNLIYEASADAYSNIDSVQLVPQFKRQNYSVFGQVFYRYKNLNVVAGARVEILESYGTVVNPKFGALYKITENMRLRGSYSIASQEPSPYIANNHFYLEVPMPPAQATTSGMVQVGYNNVPLQPVRLANIEGGFAWDINKKISLDLVYYRHRIQNNLFARAQFPQVGLMGNYLPGIYDVGYFNLNSESVLNGIEVYVLYSGNKLRADLGINYNIGHEEIGELDDIDKYRAVPDVMVHSNIRYKLKDNIFTLNARVFSGFIDKVTLVNADLYKSEVDGYYNIDISYTRVLAKQFFLYAKVTNVTNSINKGIYTNWLAAYPLDYIPQLNRQFTVGLTYNLK